jgi:hypothetical protein
MPGLTHQVKTADVVVAERVRQDQQMELQAQAEMVESGCLIRFQDQPYFMPEAVVAECTTRLPKD